MVVGFDLDDTLMNEMEFVRSALDEAALEWTARLGGNREIARNIVRGKMPAEAFDSLAAYLSSLSTDAPDALKLVERYRVHRPQHLSFRPGMEEMLADLKKRGITLALVTDGRSCTQRAKTDALGLEKFFAPDHIFISGETGYDKHHPQNFLAIRDLHPREHDFVYVGNNPLKDFLEARRSGFRTVCVPPDTDDIRTYDWSAIPPEAMPDLRAGTLDEVLRFILSPAPYVQ